MRPNPCLFAPFIVLVVLPAGGCSHSPGAPRPASPDAVGVWRHGGLAFVLRPDGTGEQPVGRRRPAWPLTWTQRGGAVTLRVRDPALGGYAEEEKGRFSPDGRALIITQMRIRLRSGASAGPPQRVSFGPLGRQ